MKNLRYLWFFLWYVYFNLCYSCFFVLFEHGPSGFVKGFASLPAEIKLLTGRDASGGGK